MAKPLLAVAALSVGLATAASAAPAASSAPPGSYLVAHPEHASPLLAAPGGRVLATVRPRTEFGSPSAVSVVARRGRWLEVTSELLPNGRLAWLDAARVHVATVRFSVRVDRARRLLEVLDRGRVIRRMTVAIGAAGSPTPAGRFAITDKLDGAPYGSVYGCCILALSGHQPHPPAGWSRTEEWRLAIHGGGGIGGAVSAGCLHASEADLHYLMRTLPRGTPVFIR